MSVQNVLTGSDASVLHGGQTDSTNIVQDFQVALSGSGKMSQQGPLRKCSRHCIGDNLTSAIVHISVQSKQHHALQLISQTPDHEQNSERDLNKTKESHGVILLQSFEKIQLHGLEKLGEFPLTKWPTKQEIGHGDQHIEFADKEKLMNKHGRSKDKLCYLKYDSRERKQRNVSGAKQFENIHEEDIC